MEEYWRSRFIARIFYDNTTSYVLKGATSILARIPDTRRTRDLDLFAQGFDIDEAIEEIDNLTKRDLGDFCRFDLTSNEVIQQETAGRHGYRLKYQLHIGTRKVTSLINVDLIFGCEPTAEIETVFPKNIEGFPLSNHPYQLYPLVDHIADKVCAIMDKYGDEALRG
jgi:hypothetical protein